MDLDFLMNKQRLVVIIPAYNEAKTVGHVVRVATSSVLVDEVVVVSDGSTDETSVVASQAGARVIALPQNLGKGGALVMGIKQTHSDIIVFLDADLLGFTTEHLEQLIAPVLSGTHAMIVGMRDRGVFLTGLAHHLPLISGERAMLREVAEGIPDRFYKGFMIEAAFNYYCRTRKMPYRAIDLHGLSIRHKYQKVGWPKAVVQYMRMSLQILSALIRVRIANLIGLF